MFTHEFRAACRLLPLLIAVTAQSVAAQPAPRGTPPPPAVRQTAPGPIAGVQNYTPVDATIACAGAVSPSSMQAIKAAGFNSIVNLRTADEEGPNLSAAKMAAAASGLVYVHIPLSPADPKPGSVDQFLGLAADRRKYPMLLHCASGGRASMLWAIKRVMVDGWTVGKAMAEVPSLSAGMRPSIRAFGLEYLKNHGKTVSEGL